MIQRPLTLAEIPHDLVGSSGQILAAEVYAVAGPKKRKRSELAVAIDHQGINIYDVQSSKIITSYAVSPQASFTCPPCSIRYRRQGSEAPRRYTYCSIASPKPQIHCFFENSTTKSSPVGEIASSSIKLSKKTSPVVALDTFHISGENDDGTATEKVLAVHEDGTITCYPKDLESQEWCTQISSIHESAPSLHVEHATVASVGQARQAILKNREDLLASLGTSGEESGGCLLFVTVRSATNQGVGGHGTLELRIFNIEAAYPEPRGLSMTGWEKLKELISLQIPQPGHFLSKSCKIVLQVTNASMYQNAEGQLAIYDFTGSVPRLAHELSMGQDVTSSFLQLSHNLLACSNADSLFIIDLPYCSIQGERNLADTRKSKKREDRGIQTARIQLLSYFASLDLAIALDGRKLVLVQLSTIATSDSGSRKRKRDGCLLNSIGRGSKAAKKIPSNGALSNRKIKSLGTYLPSTSVDEIRSGQEAELDHYASEGNVGRFETTAASMLGVKPTEKGMVILQSPRHSLLEQRIIYHIISKIFSVDETQGMGREETSDAPKKLSVRFFPRKICDFLMSKGLFTTSLVERSLKSSGAVASASKLVAGSLIHVLAEFDTSLELLSGLLASPVPLESVELVHVLAIVTRGSELFESTEGPRPLTNSDARDNEDDVQRQLTNGKITRDSLSPPPIHIGGEHNYGVLMMMTMRRLYACTSSSIARALKTELSTSQLRVLVDALRMEIARSGWLSSCEDSPEPRDPNFQDNSQICYIAHLLNCTIDSIGTGGWILGTSVNDDFTETADTIAYMKAEISAALEGIEEATYLKGMLGEILLCGKETLRSGVVKPRSNEVQLAVYPPKPLKLSLQEESNALPLGLKPAQVISMTKVGAGGELMKRSMRDIGRQKSKMVGKYSFERIVI